MKLFEFTIPGRIPSKKNSKQFFVNRRTGKRFQASSNDYLKWEWQTVKFLKTIQPKSIITKCLEVRIEFVFPDDRSKDLTNATEGIMDALVRAKVLKDDCWQITGPMKLIPKGIDRKNYGAKVQIIY